MYVYDVDMIAVNAPMNQYCLLHLLLGNSRSYMANSVCQRVSLKILPNEEFYMNLQVYTAHFGWVQSIGSDSEPASKCRGGTFEP